MAPRWLIVLALFAAACGGAGADPESVATEVSTEAEPSTTTAAPTTTTVDAEPTTITVPAESTTTTTTPTRACTRVADFEDTDWFIVNDGVMGGRSEARGAIDASVLVWTGTIVTAGGGFSSIRGPVDGEMVGATELTMRIRTDGRAYELLADDALPGREGRVTHYNPIDAVGGDWEEVTVPLTAMEARIFGNPVTDDPFAPDLATQIGVILADGTDGDFAFEIDWIDACA